LIVLKTKADILKFLSENKSYFRDKYHIVRIGLFGSYARDEEHATSDVDLVVEFVENTPNLFCLKQEIKSFIKKGLGLDVDLAREKYLKPRYKDAILKETLYAD
jgi:predicted nucleotidyltransferase